MEKLYCFECDDFVEYKMDTIKSTYKVSDEEIEIEENIAVCKTCGSRLEHDKFEEENTDRLYNKYRKKHNMLFPEEIKNIRKQYGLTQREMSQLLGWGEITYHRYENGSLPDKAHHNQLLLIRNPQNVKDIMKNQKKDLNEDLKEKLEKKIDKLIAQKNTIEIKLTNDIYKGLKKKAANNNLSIERYSEYLITKKYYQVEKEEEIERIKAEVIQESLRQNREQQTSDIWNKNLDATNESNGEVIYLDRARAKSIM